jgi:hypothetical protein
MGELSRLARIWPQWWNKSTLKTFFRKVPSLWVLWMVREGEKSDSPA